MNTCHLAITMKGDLEVYEKYRKWSLYSWGDDIYWSFKIYICDVVPEQEKRLWDGIAKEGLHARSIT